ncbi:hypothetical protein MASR2M15_13220 [Anaerolineales bacterium]
MKLIVPILLILLGLLIFAFVWLFGQWSLPNLSVISTLPAPKTLLLNTPISIQEIPPPNFSFGMLLLNLDPEEYTEPLEILEDQRLQPLNLYFPALPASITQANTILPTPIPFPTSPPLPLPMIATAPLPDPIPTESLVENSPPPLASVSDCLPQGLPVNGLLTQRFHVYHSGIDLAVDSGTNVLSTHSGFVTFAGWSDVGYGNLVIIQSGRFITYYAHNTSLLVSLGQFVTKGTVLATSGSTGNSTGPHVHYEIRLDDVPQEPYSFDTTLYGNC